MRTRHLGQALVALAVAAATIGVGSLPASAGAIATQAGTLTVIGAESQVIHVFDFDPTTSVACAPATDVFTMNSATSTWALTLSKSLGENVNGQNFKVALTMSLTGTYSGSNLTGTSGTLTAVFVKSTATNSCVPNTGAGNCTLAVTVVPFIVTGTHTVTVPPHIQPGAQVLVSGDNLPEGDLGFEVTVIGTATSCGSLVGADDGAVVLTGLSSSPSPDTLHLIGGEGQLVHLFDLDPTTSLLCTPIGDTFTLVTTTGAWVFTVSRTFAENIGGQYFKVTLTMTLTGTYTGTTAGILTGTSGTATAVLVKSTATSPCTPTTGAGNCTVAITSLIVTGTFSVTLSGAVVSGNNGPEGDLGFEVAVSGTGSNCGSLLGADDGAVVLTNLNY
jgi:hypothetical protein